MTTKRRCRMLIVFKNSNSTRWFFIVTLLCAIFTVCAFVRCHTFFVESQNKIVENQTRQTIVVDSLLTSFRESIKEHSNNKEQVVRQIIADSILVKLPKLSVYHRNAVRQYLEATIIASSNELSYASMLSDLETTLATKQLSQIQDSTKSLLELEFNKIQHEYEALALWGGILTIVFLIFSFYSLFKTDQLAQQGQSALTKIDTIINRAEEKASKIDDKAQQLINRSEQKLINNRKEIDGILKKVLAEANKEIASAKVEAEGVAQNIKKQEEELVIRLGQIDEILKEATQTAQNHLSTNMASIVNEYNESISDVKLALSQINQLKSEYETILIQIKQENEKPNVTNEEANTESQIDK